MGVTHFTVVVMYKLWFSQHNTYRNWTRVHTIRTESTVSYTLDISRKDNKAFKAKPKFNSVNIAFCRDKSGQTVVIQRQGMVLLSTTCHH